MATNTAYCFRADDRQGDGRSDRPLGNEQEQRDTSPAEGVLCKHCGQVVTGRDKKIKVGGSHAHTFFNPAGIVFELGCFSIAPGCNRAGESTSDFTWFAGYVWRFAFCRSCSSHLGWFYQMGDHSFFGLILSKLRE